SPFQFRDGLIGLGTNPPPQLGHTLPRMRSTHAAQNVHSYVKMRASTASGGSGVCSVRTSVWVQASCSSQKDTTIVRSRIFRTADVRARTSAVRVMSVVAEVSPSCRGPVGQKD